MLAAGVQTKPVAVVATAAAVRHAIRRERDDKQVAIDEADALVVHCHVDRITRNGK
jgi:hypothetical protein